MKKQMTLLCLMSLLLGVVPMQANMALVKEGCQKSTQGMAQLLQGLGSVSKGSALMAANVVRNHKIGSLITAAGLSGVLILGGLCLGLSHYFEGDAYYDNQITRAGAWLVRGPWEGAKMIGNGVHSLFIRPFNDWRVGRWLHDADTRLRDLQKAAYKSGYSCFKTTNIFGLECFDKSAIDALAHEINLMDSLFSGSEVIDFIDYDGLNDLRSKFKIALGHARDDVLGMRVNKLCAKSDALLWLRAAGIAEDDRQGYIDDLVG